MRVMLIALFAVALVAAPAGAQGFTMRMTGDISIPPGTVHDGTVVTMNGRVQVDGTLYGDAMTMNGDVTISGTVTGSVRTFNGGVFLAPTARVDGDIWAGNGRVDRQPGSAVGGRITEGWVVGTPGARSSPTPAPRPGSGVGEWMSRAFFEVLAAWVLIGFIVLAAAVSALFPQQIQRVSTALSDAPGQALLAGVLLWVLLPPMAMALVVSVVGIPALAFVPLGLSVLGLVGFAAAAMLLGNRITEAFRWHIGPVPDTIAGAAVLAVLALVPALGWLAVFAAVTWGIGGVLLLVFRRRSPVQAPPVPSSSS